MNPNIFLDSTTDFHVDFEIFLQRSFKLNKILWLVVNLLLIEGHVFAENNMIGLIIMNSCGNCVSTYVEKNKDYCKVMLSQAQRNNNNETRKKFIEWT